MIAYLRSRAVAEITRYYERTAHPYVELLPRARVGLHAIARTCLSPGDRVLISPVTCHTVMEALLQAGVVPLFADIDPRDGNIDVSRLHHGILKNVRAIVTTNLYGNPDAAGELSVLARRHGLLMVEDCAHVFETTVEDLRVGAIGDLSVFSFKKFFDVPGGVLTGKDAGRIGRIREWLTRFARYPSAGRELTGWARNISRRGGMGRILEIRHRFAKGGRERGNGYAGAESGAGSATAERGWRCDMTDFRDLPVVADIETVASRLAHPERFREDWDRGNRELIRRAPLDYLRSPYPSSVVHMAVPFVTPDRDAVLERLRRSGIPVWFLYNPPMNFRYREAVPPDFPLELDRLEEWRRRILPLPGKHAGAILSELARPSVALQGA